MATGILDVTVLPEKYILQSYEITGLLGRGGFGVTYKAFDINLESTVALKEYFPSDISYRTSEFSIQPISVTYEEDYYHGIKRFIDEARIISKFDHDNLARVYSYFEANNTGYMVMKYERGTSLTELRKLKQFDEQELKDIFFQLLDALYLIHDANYIHRDIKPDNIIIRDDGTPVLIDFGAARNAEVQSKHNLTCQISSGYAPIEQYTIDTVREKQGAWTDIYSFCATIYYVITGIEPSPAPNRAESIVQTDMDTYVPLNSIANEKYSGKFLDFIDRGLAFKKDERPQSIREWLSGSGYNLKNHSSGKTVNNTKASDPALDNAEKISEESVKKSNLGKKRKKVYLSISVLVSLLIVLLPLTYFYQLKEANVVTIKDEVTSDTDYMSTIETYRNIKRKTYAKPDKNIEPDSVRKPDSNQSQNFSEAVNTLLPLAEQGNVIAQNDLGIIYFIRDISKSLKWYRKAAEQGYIPAQITLGHIYYNGIMVDVDDKQAFHWFRQAAEQDSAEAKYMLGLMYLNGEGTERNKERGNILLSEAGQKGHENAQDSLREIERQLELLSRR